MALPAVADGDPSAIRFSEVIASLSRALDLADGHDLGHSARSCLVGMRLGRELGIGERDQPTLLYSLLLKDAGCSSNAARIAALYGADDLAVKRNAKKIDHTRPAQAFGYIWRNVGGRGPTRVLYAARATTLGPKIVSELTAQRCERGAEIAGMLGLPPKVAEAIRAVDEHWDGGGHPVGLAGDEIPVVARILALAQAVEVYASDAGVAAAIEMARDRSGRWFDPDLVAALESIADDGAFWSSIDTMTPEHQIGLLEPVDLSLAADESRLDKVSEAFALVIDSKSPYTAKHSTRVSEIAVAVGRELDVADPDLRHLRRAGLLHDIGKLGVSNRILDKPGALAELEWAAMRRHTEYTAEILGRIPAFVTISTVAAAHHERLDGSGYHRGLRGDELGRAARILAVADVYEALTAERPYREALDPQVALDIVRADTGTRLCAEACDALEHALRHAPASL